MDTILFIILVSLLGTTIAILYLNIRSKPKSDNKESEEIANLKNEIITSLTDEGDKEATRLKINAGYNKLITEIQENSNIHIITKNKTDEDISVLLDELIQDHRDQSNLRKIESLEQKLINNLDENSYSELIKLKSQLNRE